MNKKNNTTNLEKYQEQIKELFKELISEELYNKWADSFDIYYENEKKVNIYYHGTENIKLFKKECGKTLKYCIYSVMGDGKKIKISKKNIINALSPKTKKNIRAVKFFVFGMFFVCIAAAVIIVLLSYIANRDFKEKFYSTSSIKIDSSVRVIQLSDLHETSYGKDNSRLLERVEALAPDIIICTGDIVDSTTENIDYALNLAEGLSKIAPSYYIYGNNEVADIYGFPFIEADLDKMFGFDANFRDENALLEIEDTFEEQLEKTGIKVLKNEKDTIKIKTMTVDVYGVLNSNPSSFWSYSGKAFANYLYENPDNLKIMAIHEPFIFEEFEPEFWGDLMVCGHTHGGVMRIPILGPLYTHEGGLFPERSGHFIYGRYDVAGKPLIVSAGLDNSTLLRINNEPELVIIDINKF